MLENILPVEDLSSIARAKGRSYVLKSVHPKLVDDEVGKGWEVQKKNKSSVRLRRPKTHGVQLEDRVWMLLYRMQFGYMSAAGGAKLLVDSKIPDGPKTQIDVVGIEDELALAVECKSQEKFGKRSQFQEELAKLVQIREKFIRSSNEQFKGPHRRQSALLFFVSNVDLSNNDKERAKEANVNVFDERDLDYYEKLSAHIGPAAKYQFFADMLPGKSVPG